MTDYILNTDSFIGGTLIPAGSRITYSGPLGPQFEPVDKEGEGKLAEYYKANPHASLNPLNSLSLRMDDKPPVAATATVVSEPPPATLDRGIEGLAHALTSPAVPQETALASLGNVDPRRDAPEPELPVPGEPAVTVVGTPPAPVSGPTKSALK